MWYSASLLFTGERNDRGEPLWEEQIVLIRAVDETGAKARAEHLGKEQEHGYTTAEKVAVTWRFVCVERVFSIELGELGDGAEVFSRFLRDSEAKSLLTPFDRR